MFTYRQMIIPQIVPHIYAKCQNLEKHGNFIPRKGSILASKYRILDLKIILEHRILGAHHIPLPKSPVWLNLALNVSCCIFINGVCSLEAKCF